MKLTLTIFQSKLSPRIQFHLLWKGCDLSTFYVHDLHLGNQSFPIWLCVRPFWLILIAWILILFFLHSFFFIAVVVNRYCLSPYETWNEQNLYSKYDRHILLSKKKKKLWWNDSFEMKYDFIHCMGMVSNLCSMCHLKSCISGPNIPLFCIRCLWLHWYNNSTNYQLSAKLRNIP